MTTNVTLRAGHDVAYFTRGQKAGGCAGAMSYYTAAGEPPGVWAGRAAARLGLAGEVDAGVVERLFMKGIAPDGELVVKRRQSKKAAEREAASVAAFLAAHPYASAAEVAEVRAAERGKDPHAVPYFDFTVSAVKSVSVLHASYRESARQARGRGDTGEAAALDAKADEIEKALMDSAREAVGWLERHATYTRTGHHSETTGEYRDGGGLAAGLFLHHISRDGDPQLHVHVAIWNRVQRADGADEKWRTLDSRTLHAQRLAVAAVTDRIMETKLTGLGYAMVPRADGNGAEVGGVGQDVRDLFSSRSVAVTGELKRLAAEYEAGHGIPPSRRTLWLLHQQAGQNTRRSKSEARRTVAGRTGSEEPDKGQRLAAWEAQTTREETQALSQVHGQVARYAAEHAELEQVALCAEDKRRAARIAVAEVQKHHAIWSMAQLSFEVHRALPVLPAGTDAAALITEVAELAVSGRAGTETVCVTAPDVADVTTLGVRASDGRSIYRPPNEDRYTTLEHLDTEEQILATARQATRQAVTEDQAREAVRGVGDDLNPEQAAAVVAMLTAVTAATALIAPAGAGKSHTMAAFAALWEHLTGRRVIGLATSTNAARVLAGEGLAESYNIAAFLGKIEGSSELRRPVPLHAGDVLVIDEATQASTADLAMLLEAARAAGARVILVGDTQQLGSPEAGGMFRLLAREVPAAELAEVRRFREPWEAAASVKLRAGDFTAIAAYDRHGRVRGADEEAARDRAASAWLADHLRGKETLLLAGSNEEAADLARRVQAKLLEHGTVTAGAYQARAPLADGNHAHPGDLIRARLNAKIDAGGQNLTNRDTLKISAIRGDGADVRRRQADGTWAEPFWVPRAYLQSSAELGYAGNVHVAQGRTVDTTHLLVTDTLSRQSLYVGMSRGREANTAHVVTGSTAGAGQRPYEQATPEAVLKNAMDRDAAEQSATEAIRQSQEQASGTGHLAHLWTNAVRPSLSAEIDRQVTARLSEAETFRYQREHARKALHAALRAVHLAGHDINAVIGQITQGPMDGARSISAVLHGRLQKLPLPEPGHHPTWAERTLASAPAIAGELAEALDARPAELGRTLAADPEPWLTDRLGILPPDASPLLRADYERRAGIAAAYREAAGITNPYQGVSPEPHHGNPELEDMRKHVIRELEYPDEAAIWAGMNHGQLEAHIAAAGRAHAAAPPDVSSQLRATAHAEADAWQQAAGARASGDNTTAQSAENLARLLAAERQGLETQNAGYEQWAEGTRAVRENGDKATAELRHRGRQAATRGTPQAGHGRPGSETEWFRRFDADIAGVGRTLDAEHQAAVAAGQPWPPQRHREREPEPGPAPGDTTLQWWRQLDTPDPDAAHVDPAWHAQVKAAQAAGIQASQAESGSMTQWARQFSADAAAVDRALDNQRQAAEAAGRPWPARRDQAPAGGAKPRPTLQWEPQPGQEAAHVDRASWARAKAAQTAAVEAGKAASREAAARAVPVTDAEIALYGTQADGPGQHETPGQYHARLQSYAQWQPEAHPEAAAELGAPPEARAGTPEHAEIEL
jgi:flagellar biosynthesis GTPase FlhF